MCTTSKGNRYLRSLVNSYQHSYSGARNKIQKSTIVSTIIDEVKQASPKGGAFIKYEDGGWWEVDDAFAREKIGGLFRDFLHMQYRSSTKAKLARRKVKGQPQSSSTDDYSFDGSSHDSSNKNSSSFSPPQQEMDLLMPKEVESSTFPKKIVPADHAKPADSLLKSTQEQYSSLWELVTPVESSSSFVASSSMGAPHSAFSDWRIVTDLVLDDFPDDISDIFDDDSRYDDGFTNGIFDL
jgi:hypothetical protein